jgi:hypothetical protein
MSAKVVEHDLGGGGAEDRGTVRDAPHGIDDLGVCSLFGHEPVGPRLRRLDQGRSVGESGADEDPGTG